MKYVIITENDESQWDDKTGVSYNYPSKYSKILLPGTKAIYYKGKLRDKKFQEIRLSNSPHYFGVAIIGESYLDHNASKKEYHCDILTYQPFDKAVPFKIDDDYLETIPESREANYWRDGVREVTKETFDKILELASVQFESSVEINNYRISFSKFEKVVSLFPEFILHESNGKQFTGFSDGYLYERESYKTKLRDKSLKILETSDWGTEWIGQGIILKRIIETFELETNNLVGKRKEFGPDSIPYNKMKKAYDSKKDLIQIELTLFNLYKTNQEAKETFNQLVDIIGKQYSVIAFLFYLKNDREYLPISTSNFEYAFKALGCNLTLSRNCSWDNYKSYLQVIKQVKDALESRLNQKINLIDAHSFCWLIGYRNRFEEWLIEKSILKNQLVYNAYEITPVNNPSNQRLTIPNNTNSDENIDWDKENKRKRIKGRKAEELVLEFERQRLSEAGKESLANKVEDFSTKYGKGFDILSWNIDGSERNIEVKSSDGNNFILTRNELNKSETNPNYWIYIVKEKKNEVEIKQIKAPSLKDETQFRLEPKDYYVSFDTTQKSV